MPNIKSAVKRVKVNQRKFDANKRQKSALRTTIKKAMASVDASVDSAPEQIKDAQIALDKAVSRGLIHKNQAARRKSRIAKYAKRTSADK